MILEDLPLLSFIIFLPLFSALFVIFMKEPEQGSKEAKWGQRRNCWSVAFLASWATFVLSLFLLFTFDSQKEGYQWVDQGQVLGPLKMQYSVGVDGISLCFVLLTTLLTPFALMASVKGIRYKVRTYVASFLILETMMLGTFCSLDSLYFYIFFEAVLIPMFLIIGIWGGERRIYSAFKFFLYTLLGSVLMLVALMTMIHTAQTTSIPLMQTFSFEPSLQTFLWLAFFASFAVKLPLWPFHTWLPDAHVEAPTGGSVILAGILLKMGGYGFLRFSIPMFPDACQTFAPYIYALCVVGVIYTSLVALVQTDMKKLIAYSSVAHMGIATFGLFSFDHDGIQGGIFQMLSHGLISGALFLCIGTLYDRFHSREIALYGGLARIMPLFAVAFMIFTFASIGLPGTTGFVGEILVLMSAFKIGGFWAAFLGLGMILSAAYGLWLYSRLMLNKVEREELKKFPDLTPFEKTCFIPLGLLVIILGFYPKPLLTLTSQAVKTVMTPYEFSKTTLTDASFDFLLGDPQ